MADEYRLFFLTPGQMAPKGSTGRALKCGGIVWIGDKGTFPEKVTLGKRSFMDKVSNQTYKNRLMTDEEIEEYKKPVPLEVE